METEPEASTGSITMEAATVTTETQRAIVKGGDWVLGFKTLKGITQGLQDDSATGQSRALNTSFSDFLKRNQKLMITWNTDKALSEADSKNWWMYEKAVELTL